MSNRATRRAAKHRPATLAGYQTDRPATAEEIAAILVERPQRNEEPAPPAPSFPADWLEPEPAEPLDVLAAANEAVKQAVLDLDRAATSAVRGGASLAAVGRVLGISRQAAAKRYRMIHQR